MKRMVSGSIGSQEMFELEGRLKVNRIFSETQAAEMAFHRGHRIGNLALTEATRGFKRSVSGLWVPHSGTENSAVVYHPVAFVRQSAQIVKDKVFEKYLGDGSEHNVAETRVAVWAEFAGNRQRSALSNQFDAWRQDGRNKAALMNPGFNTDGYVERDFVESSPEVMGSIAAYLADLKSYIGHPDMMRGVKRVWMQDRQRIKREEHSKWTQEFLRKQPDWEFDRWFAESYYNHRSRAKFWYDVIQKSSQIHEDIVVQRRISKWREDMERRGYDV